MLSAIASITSRVTLGPFVACTSFREPALLAKMADTLDEVSGGRLLLGLGAGYHVPEYTAFGYPHDHLAGRFEEALQIILPLLRGEMLQLGHFDWPTVDRRLGHLRMSRRGHIRRTKPSASPTTITRPSDSGSGTASTTILSIPEKQVSRMLRSIRFSIF